MWACAYHEPEEGCAHRRLRSCYGYRCGRRDHEGGRRLHGTFRLVGGLHGRLRCDELPLLEWKGPLVESRGGAAAVGRPRNRGTKRQGKAGSPRAGKPTAHHVHVAASNLPKPSETVTNSQVRAREQKEQQPDAPDGSCHAQLDAKDGLVRRCVPPRPARTPSPRLPRCRIWSTRFRVPALKPRSRVRAIASPLSYKDGAAQNSSSP